MIEEKLFDESEAAIDRGIAAITSGMIDSTDPKAIELVQSTQKTYQQLRDYLRDLKRVCYHPNINDIENANKTSDRIIVPPL